MHRWGLVITACYALAVVVLLAPGAILAAGGDEPYWNEILAMYRDFDLWIIACILVGGQAALLFVSVDSSFKRLKPRAHIAVSVATSSCLFAVLATAAIWTIGAGIRGDHFSMPIFSDNVWALWAALWGIWAIVFFLYFRTSNASVARVVGWLLKGSVLEFLVAVASHVVVRRRGECCAPGITAFGMATGLALMLLCFGPSVLFLFKKRLDAYHVRGNAAASSS